MWHLDTSNNYHWIESAPSKNVAAIARTLQKLTEVQEKHADNSAPVISLLNLIADYAGVERSLLFEDVEGVLNAIATVNFSHEACSSDNALEDKKSNNKEQESLSLEDYHYQLVTSLVNAELAVNLESALKVASTTPYKDLEGYLKARIKFLNRDPEKEQQEKAGKELIQELSNGSFFGEVKPDGSDGFRDGVFRAMGIKTPLQNGSTTDLNNIPDSVKQSLSL